MRVILLLGLLWGAQSTTVLLYDISALGPNAKPYSAELDGNPATREYLVDFTGSDPAHPHYWMIRTAQERAGGVCLGPWYDPRDPLLRGLPEAKELDVQTIRGVTVAEVSAFVPSIGKRMYQVIRPLPPTVCVAP